MQQADCYVVSVFKYANKETEFVLQLEVGG